MNIVNSGASDFGPDKGPGWGHRRWQNIPQNTSSSEVASSGARSPITLPGRAKRMSCFWRRSALTEGATWHAAGLVGQLRSSRNTTRMLKKSVEMYDRLEAETGMSFDWKKVGSLRLAATSDRMLEAQRLCTMARSFDLEMRMVTASRGQGPVSLYRRHRPSGRGVHPVGRPCRPGQPVPGHRQRGASAGRRYPPGRGGHLISRWSMGASPKWRPPRAASRPRP